CGSWQSRHFMLLTIKRNNMRVTILGIALVCCTLFAFAAYAQSSESFNTDVDQANEVLRGTRVNPSDLTTAQSYSSSSVNLRLSCVQGLTWYVTDVSQQGDALFGNYEVGIAESQPG